jgi:hypothetical protein
MVQAVADTMVLVDPMGLVDPPRVLVPVIRWISNPKLSLGVRFEVHQRLN